MSNLRTPKIIKSTPKVKIFIPKGIAKKDLQYELLSLEEYEVIRLKCTQGLGQIGCAKAMNTSQSTIQRILCSCMKKIGTAIIEGKGIQIV